MLVPRLSQNKDKFAGVGYELWERSKMQRIAVFRAKRCGVRGPGRALRGVETCLRGRGVGGQAACHPRRADKSAPPQSVVEPPHSKALCAKRSCTHIRVSGFDNRIEFVGSKAMDGCGGEPQICVNLRHMGMIQ